MRPDERGQALVLLVALLGLAALVVGSLVDADARLLARLHAQRVAEAAAEAAGVAVSDALLELREEDLVSGRRRDVIDAALADVSLESRARLSAAPVVDALGGELGALTFKRRIDELSVRAEIRVAGTDGVARVGVRPP